MEDLNQASGKQFLAGALALLGAVPIALAVNYIGQAWSGEAEKGVKIVGVVFAFLAFSPLALYFLHRRKRANLGEAGLIFIAAVGVLLAASYFYRAGFYVFFPADIFIWSESEFVNDILKFREGYPIFSAQVNNESFHYPPGTQLLTYFGAWVAGQPGSIPAYRIMQVVYTLLAAIVAFFCCRRLVETVVGKYSKILASRLWGAVWLVGLFLIATNALTNPFVHLLHNDALAQLVMIAAFWLLVEYETSRDKRIWWLMALIPGIGFWVKQSLIIWAVLYPAYLLIFLRPRSIRKSFGLAVAASGGILISLAVGNFLWHEHFTYWIFTVLGAHGVSPLRSFQHLLDVWVYFAVGLLGGLVLMQFDESKKLFGLWLVWLLVIAVETYTSGVAWMLNHIGPGCLLAGVWFWAALAIVWTKYLDSTLNGGNAKAWLRAGVATAAVCLLFNGLAVVRVPVQPFDRPDAERYVREIENEFGGLPTETVLLDFGTWVYLPDGIVMKDRAPTIGERGYSQTGDFSGVLQRLEQKHYRKILVRNFHSEDFWYDHELWSKPSGIRRALTENYVEIRKIEAVKGIKPNEMPYGFNEISIFVPKEN